MLYFATLVIVKCLHELGHAFGYGHYDVKGHIMHSLYEQMGPMFW